MIEITTVDFSQWELAEYIERILVIKPQKPGMRVKYVHLPQVSELLVLNAQLDSTTPHTYLCGKSTKSTVYHVAMDEPVCVVQFKAHAFYAFTKPGVKSYKNKVLRFNCDIEGRLDTFVEHSLPQYLQRLFDPKKLLRHPIASLQK